MTTNPDTTTPTIKLLLTVTKWGANIYSSQSNIPRPNPAKSEVGIVRITGQSHSGTPEGLAFVVTIYPDGTVLPHTEYRVADKIVNMSMSAAQMPSLLHILKHATSAHALYRVDAGVVHADIHGEFSRVP